MDTGFDGFELKNGVPQFRKDAANMSGCSAQTCWLHGHNRAMQALVADLARNLQMPVMDATGLEGGYDYTLIYTPEQAAAFRGDEPLEYPLIRDALREQLGLELRPVKDVPVDVVIIDSAKKKPTEN